jgi:hypothetical protein
MSDTQRQVLELVYSGARATADAQAFAAGEQKRTREIAAAALAATKSVVDANKAGDAEIAKSHAETAQALAKATADAAKAARDSDQSRATSSKAVDAEIGAMKRQAAKEAVENVRAFEKTVIEGEKTHEAALGKQKKGWDDQNTSILASLKSAGAFALSMMGLNSASVIVHALAEKFDALRLQTIAAAKEVMGYRVEVLELAAMKDRLGNTTPEVEEQLQFRQKTLQSRQAAIAFSTAAEGAGQAAIGVNITREAFTKGKEAAGKLQAMENSDPAAYGALFGTLALEAAKGTTGEELAGMINKEYQISKPGKFVSMAQYAHQREQLTPYVQTGALTGAQASALVSAISTQLPPEEAATVARQILVSTSADFMRARKMKVLAGTEQETSAEYFQKHLGLSALAATQEIWEAAAADINKEAVKAKAKGEFFSADRYLMEHGLTNAEARRGYAIMAGLYKQEQWQKTFQPLIDLPLDPAALDKIQATRMGREPLLLQRQADLAHDVAQATLSTRAAGALAQLQRAAFERLAASGKVSGTFEEWQGLNPLSRLWADSPLGHGYTAVNLEAERMLKAEADRVGVPFALKPGEKGAYQSMFDAAPELTYIGDEALFALQQRVQRAGGNPLAGVATDSKRAADSLERMEKAISKPSSAMAPPPAPDAGPPPPLPALPINIPRAPGM